MKSNYKKLISCKYITNTMLLKENKLKWYRLLYKVYLKDYSLFNLNHGKIKILANFINLEIEDDYYERINKIVKNGANKSTLENMKLRYGNELGSLLKELKNKKCTITRSNFSSDKEYKEYCDRKTKAMKQHMVDNPEDLRTMVLEKFIKKHGETEGTKRYNKAISMSIRRKEYWIEKGFSEEDAKKKVSNIQTTFSKEKCIEKHGNEKGLVIWQERQNKWQDTLNSKSKEELDFINAKKSQVFKQLINDFNYSEEDAFSVLNNIDLNELKKYKREIDICTNETYEMYINEIDPERKRSNDFHLDHKFSRIMGFIFDISPFIMSLKHNLELLTKKENMSKNSKCSISINELYDNYNVED